MTGAPQRAVEDAPAADGASLHDVRGVLRYADFRKLWVALSLSSLGDWLGFLATTALAAELVTSYSGKLYAVGGVLFVRLLPAVLIGPFAGAFADRFNRRLTMVTADVFRFGLFLSIPFVGTLPWLLVSSFLVECLSLFWIPAKEASVPNLVPRERLEAANQLSLMTTYGSAALASVVFSVLAVASRGLGHLSHFFRTNPVDLALYFDAATFLFSAATVFGLRRISSPGSVRHEEPQGIVPAIVDGWRFVGRSRWLRGLVIGISGATAAGGSVIGLSRLFVNDLQGGNAAYGVLFGTVFAGLASGMFLGPRAFEGFSRRRLMGLAIIASGVALGVDAVSPNLALAMVFTFLLGGFAGIVWVVGITLVGLEVSDELRGRTFAFVYNLMRVVLLAMLAAAPFVAGAIGRHSVEVADLRVRLDGVTLVLFASGVGAVVIGLVSYRMMDDRRHISIWADLVATVRRRAPVTGRGTQAGFFVALEGGEGAGKSTQARLLGDWLRARGHEVVLTLEPGDTRVGRQLREVLLDHDTAGLTPQAEALLYAADRAQHVAEVLRPALRRDAVVVCDRYVDSSLAYQGAGRALPGAWVARLSRWATEGLRPDLTVLLDVPPEVGLRRSSAPADRMEAESLGFHARVRERFLELARSDPERYLVLDAVEPAEGLHRRIVERLTPLLPEPRDGHRGPPPTGSTAVRAVER